MPSPEPIKLYLAARFTRRNEMERIADGLKIVGFNVVARWVYGGEEGLNREQVAIIDLEDVDKADTVVSFTEPHGTHTPGGGRHVEFGYALAQGKRVVVIGERENVFHHHPEVEIFPSVAAWLSHDAGVANAAE